MPFDNSTLAANIRAERARRRISQEELAEKTGVSAASIVAYESAVSKPGVDKLFAIAEALGTTPNDLLGWS